MGARGGLAAGLRSCLDEQAAQLLCPPSPAHHRQRALTANSTVFRDKRGENGCFMSSLRDPVLLIAQQWEELLRGPPGQGSTAGVIIPVFLCPGLGEKLGKSPLCWLW